jgi:hypothetical protein
MSAATAPVGEPGAYELAYQEAIRALEEQERAVSETRSRAGQLIAAAAITTSFFGGQAISDHRIHVAGWFAIGCFLGLSVAVIAILWPRHDWEFTLSPSRLIATYIEPGEEPPVALAGIWRDLALHMGVSLARNRTQLRWVFIAFRIGAVLLAGEVIAWVIALIHHG